MNWGQILTGTLTGVGLIGCIVAFLAYHIRSRGAWRRYREGRWFMLFFIDMGLLFGLVLTFQIFGDWPLRRPVSIAVYSGLIGLVWGAVRLLFTARERVASE